MNNSIGKLFQKERQRLRDAFLKENPSLDYELYNQVIRQRIDAFTSSGGDMISDDLPDQGKGIAEWELAYSHTTKEKLTECFNKNFEKNLLFMLREADATIRKAPDKLQEMSSLHNQLTPNFPSI